MTPLTHLRRVAEAAKAAHASWPDTNLESPAPTSSYKAVIAFEQTFNPALVSLLLDCADALQQWYDWQGFGQKGQPIHETRDAINALAALAAATPEEAKYDYGHGCEEGLAEFAPEEGAGE